MLGGREGQERASVNGLKKDTERVQDGTDG
jgi:hypothetical protein